MKIPSPLSHAYILTGGSARSRQEWAVRLCQAYVCPSADPPCMVCRHCQKAAAGIHPDVSVLRPPEKKREIVAEQTRALRADVYTQPNEARRKVYVIQPADAMNPTAQNTLLKVLEEGPPYAAFLLVTAQPGGLLETLRSRCELLSLPPEEDTDPVLQEKGQELARLMLRGDELELAVWLAGREKEKPDSQAVLDLFQAAETALGAHLAQSPRRAAALLAVLHSFRPMRSYNVGPGHLLGALGAACAEQCPQR